MEIVRARRALPLNGQGVIDDACLVFDAESRVLLDVGGWTELRRRHGFSAGDARDLGEVTITPGVVNAHTHLDLSHTVGRTTRGQGFLAWLESLLRLDLQGLTAEALDTALDQLDAAGTGHAADIASRNPLVVGQALLRRGQSHTLFLEGIGHRPERPLPVLDESDPAQSLAGHALTTTSFERLRRMKERTRRLGRSFSLHLAEHPAEVEMLSTGQGKYADLLRAHLLPEGWRAPGQRPVELADRLGLLDERTLAAHCVHVEPGEIRLLAERRVGICLCPRGNEHIGVGAAPLESFRRADARICLGTDGLSSNADLNVWNEAIHLARRHDVTIWELLTWLCRNPAEVLGHWPEIGSLRPGSRGGYAALPAELETLPLGEEPTWTF